MSETEDVSATEPAAIDPAPADPREPALGATSARWPWLRAVAYSLIVFLSPAIWVIDTSSCTAEGVDVETTSHTGIELAQGMGVQGVVETVTFFGLLVIMLAAPWLTTHARTPLRRLGLHVLGLAGAIFGLLYAGMVVFFTLFQSREVQPVGYLVLLLAVLPVIESFARIAAGVTEVRAHRLRPARAGPRGGER